MGGGRLFELCLRWQKRGVMQRVCWTPTSTAPALCAADPKLQALGVQQRGLQVGRGVKKEEGQSHVK